MKPLKQSEIVIIGTGLMGASLALALRGHVKTLRGIDPSETARAIADPYFDHISGNLELAGADVIILAAPVKAILNLLKKLQGTAPRGALVFDLGSAKGQIVAAMDNLPDYLLAVGGHPMCGKETSGPDAADGALFQDCTFAICPSRRSTPEALLLAQQIVVASGAQPLIMDAEKHDEAVAAVSHLPYMISAGLVNTVLAESDQSLWALASSGFRDTSRLAASDVTMMGDTLLTNRDAALKVLHNFGKQVADLEAALQLADEAQLKALLTEARAARLSWASRAAR